MNDFRQTLLFVHASADLYGSDITLLQLVSGLVRARFRAVVVLPYSGPLAERLRSAGAEVVVNTALPVVRRQYMNVKGLYRLASLLPSVGWLAKLIRQREVALVHSNTLSVSIAGLAARLAGRPQIWHVHEVLVRPRIVASLLATLSSAVSTLVVANSRTTADHYRRTRWFGSTPIRVIPNGVDESRLRSRPGLSLRSLVGAGPEDTVFTLIGRINLGKGHSVFLDAAERLAAEAEDARFLIVGDSFAGQEHLTEAVDSRIRSSYVLRERMIRIPHISEVGSVYAASDVVVTPSILPESFGLVAVEAMSAGLPVIASRIGALPEVVGDHTGILVEPGDTASLLVAMEKLRASPSQRAEMGRQGRERFKRCFDGERYVTEFIRLYEEILGSSPGFYTRSQSRHRGF
jgi:glycosyltransferase involved in cell wall biosynthesis